MITETRSENSRFWTVNLIGDRSAVMKRAEIIDRQTADLMVSYCSGPRDDGHEIQMEFMKGGDA